MYLYHKAIWAVIQSYSVMPRLELQGNNFAKITTNRNTGWSSFNDNQWLVRRVEVERVRVVISNAQYDDLVTFFSSEISNIYALATLFMSSYKIDVLYYTKYVIIPNFHVLIESKLKE